MEPRFHRAQRDAEELGDVVERQVAVEAQGNYELQVRIQFWKRGAERISIRHGAKLIASSKLQDGAKSGFADLSAPPGSQSIAAQVQDYPPEPGVEARRVSQRAELAPTEQDRVVDDILGLHGVAQDDRRKPVGIVETSIAEGFERTECSGPLGPLNRHCIDHGLAHAVIVGSGLRGRRPV